MLRKHAANKVGEGVDWKSLYLVTTVISLRSGIVFTNSGLGIGLSVLHSRVVRNYVRAGKSCVCCVSVERSLVCGGEGWEGVCQHANWQLPIPHLYFVSLSLCVCIYKQGTVYVYLFYLVRLHIISRC